MEAERKAVIGGITISEYYWAGDYAVYAENRRTDMTFDEACEHYRALAASSRTE